MVGNATSRNGNFMQPKLEINSKNFRVISQNCLFYLAVYKNAGLKNNHTFFEKLIISNNWTVEHVQRDYDSSQKPWSYWKTIKASVYHTWNSYNSCTNFRYIWRSILEHTSSVILELFCSALRMSAKLLSSPPSSESCP